MLIILSPLMTLFSQIILCCVILQSKIIDSYLAECVLSLFTTILPLFVACSCWSTEFQSIAITTVTKATEMNGSMHYHRFIVSQINLNFFSSNAREYKNDTFFN